MPGVAASQLPPPLGLFLCSNSSVPLGRAPLAQSVSDASALPDSWQSKDLSYRDVLVIACQIDRRRDHNSIRFCVLNHN